MKSTSYPTFQISIGSALPTIKRGKCYGCKDFIFSETAKIFKRHCIECLKEPRRQQEQKQPGPTTPPQSQRANITPSPDSPCDMDDMDPASPASSSGGGLMDISIASSNGMQVEDTDNGGADATQSSPAATQPAPNPRLVENTHQYF